MQHNTAVQRQLAAAVQHNAALQPPAEQRCSTAHIAASTAHIAASTAHIAALTAAPKLPAGLAHRQLPVMLGSRLDLLGRQAGSSRHAVEVLQHKHAVGLHPCAHALDGALQGGQHERGAALKSEPRCPAPHPHKPQS